MLFRYNICQVFYLRPKADESLLVFRYGKKIQEKISITISFIDVALTLACLV